MIVVVTTWTTIVILLLPSMGHAKETGHYISAWQIDIDQNTSIAAGTKVNFLGVINVTLSVAVSGRLATFIYRDKIFNADVDLFYKVKNDTLISAHLFRTFFSGESATICKALTRSLDGEALDFAEKAYAPAYLFFQLLDHRSVSTRPKVQAPYTGKFHWGRSLWLALHKKLKLVGKSPKLRWMNGQSFVSRASTKYFDNRFTWGAELQTDWESQLLFDP